MFNIDKDLHPSTSDEYRAMKIVSLKDVDYG